MLNSRTCFALFLLLFTSVLLSQNINKKTDLNIPEQDLLVPADLNIPEADYKIISSNNSYIELEYYPQFIARDYINYKGEQFSVVNFANSISLGTGNEGKPDLKFRVFPIVFPSQENNSVTITNIEYAEINGINLAPVPHIVFKEPYKSGYMNTGEPAYEKDLKAYSVSSYLPESPAVIQDISPVRDILLGYLIINPYQYNPVSKSLKQIKKIRIRVNFGNTPTYINRKRSYSEYSLLKDLALNSDIAANWMNPALLNQQADSRVENSAFATGDWYRIEIKDNGSGSSEGIYKITKSFLESAGINLNGVDPRKIKMYGNGGEMLPVYTFSPRIDDIKELSIYIEGESDGKFDANDHILFYGKSVNNWKYDTLDNFYKHYISFYTLSNYYWIQINNGQTGKRMISVPSENVQNPNRPNSFREKIFTEPEINNLLNEGNLWLSSRISSGQSFNWNNTLTGLEESSNILYRVKVAARTLNPYDGFFEIKEVNSTMSPVNITIPYVPGGWAEWIHVAYAQFTINQSEKTNGEQSSVHAYFHSPGADGEAYYDWMEIQYDRKFSSVTNNYLSFDSHPADGVTEYNLSGFQTNNVKIFDITSHDEVKIIDQLPHTQGSVKFQKTEYSNNLSKYIAAGDNAFKTPGSISQKIANQNLHGYTEGADFIIIAPKVFFPAAQRIKEKRESGGTANPGYLKTVIVDIEQIYNEFSGGILDPAAIRDFIKYSYEKWTLKPTYVLLFGDGDFDYKDILLKNDDHIPPIEFTHPELNQTENWTTDDYFVDIDGENSDKPDLAIGRITVETPEEAGYYVDKLDCYEVTGTNGYWKNKVVYVADDGKTTNFNDGSQHTDQCELLAEQYTPQVYDKNKLYLIAYPTVITPGGRRKPGVNKDIITYWNAGCIGLNFTGHGSPDVWTHETVFEKDVTISQLNNNCKYPFVTIASCDFSKFDNPLLPSGGEALVTTQRKGAIGTYAATRPVSGPSNATLNYAFWDRLYFRRDTLLLQNTFGKASFGAKNYVSYDPSHKKFILIGDPTQRIQTPRFCSMVDSISGLVSDTMRALSKVKIYGSVIHPDSSLWQDYNGKIFLKLFDVTRQISMRDEDNYEYKFKIPGGIIFSGTQNVLNGKWLVEFIVPKDISFRNEKGRLINYFFNNTADGHGIYTNFFIGGINPNAPVDTTGPEIKLYINNRDFREGDVTTENFKLIADLFDESGINTTGTIGHKIDGVLDNKENLKYDFTPFYNSDSTYKSGSFEYSFSSVSEGEHIIKVKAWDTYNNSSEKTLHFIVASHSILKLMNVYNYPNPFADRTAFTFQHNYSSAVNVNIKIYTVAGRLINEILKKDITDKFVAIDWPGTDKDGEKLANGVYIYKLSVTGTEGETQIETGKLAILK
ncbi:MAG: type IX secretion system sortase PorU [Ignavibacteriae bacterium]|nr:MAG: type IX secretion system sortase PorU [Ignavibacteriota bacterium]